MDKEHTPNHNKVLIAVLSILGVLIFGLAVAIIAVSINNNDNNNNINSDDNTTDLSAGCEPNENGELYCDDVPYNDVLIDDYLANKYETVHEQVDQLLNQNPVDVDRINAIYDDLIKEAVDNNRPDYAVRFVDLRSSDLASKGLKREALDSFSRVDYSTFSDPSKYRLYAEAIELAKELNDTAALSKYEKLSAEVEAAYLEETAGSREAQENAEKEDEMDRIKKEKEDKGE